MAVVTCPQCGKMVSTGAAACTYCGSTAVPRECRACRAVVPAADWPAHRCPATSTPAAKEEETFICDRCGVEVAAAAVVCPACGNDVAEIAGDEENPPKHEEPSCAVTPAPSWAEAVPELGLRCGRCHVPLLPQFSFCPNCGTGLRAETRPDAGAPEPGAVLLLYAADSTVKYLYPQCDREVPVTDAEAIRQCPHCGSRHFPVK